MRLGGRSVAEKQRKKLAELEGQLVLASPNLVFRLGARAPAAAHAHASHAHAHAAAHAATLQRQHVFFLSSEYERTQWIDSIHALQVCSAHCRHRHQTLYTTTMPT